MINELKSKNIKSTERILNALDLPPHSKATVIGWREYLKIMTVLKYFTASKQLFLDFWMGFFNP